MPRYERDHLHSQPSQPRRVDSDNSRRNILSFGNGFEITIETGSYSSPGPPFSPLGNFGDSNPRNSFPSSQSSSRTAAVNPFNVAFDLLGSFISPQLRRQQEQERASKRQESFERHGSNRKQYSEVQSGDMASSERDSRRSGRRTRFPENPVYDAGEGKKGRQRRRDQSPVTDIPKEAWQSSRRSSQRKDSASGPRAERFRPRSKEATREEFVNDSGSKYHGSDDDRGSDPYNSFSYDNVIMVEALEKAQAEHEQKIAECNRRIQLAEIMPIDWGSLQSIREEQKRHEAVLAAVKQQLKKLRAFKPSGQAGTNHASPSASTRTSTSKESKAQAAGTEPFDAAFGFDEFEDYFEQQGTAFPSIFDDFGPFRNRPPSGPIPSVAFESLFNHPFFYSSGQRRRAPPGPGGSFFNHPLFEPSGVHRNPFSAGSTADEFPQFPGFGPSENIFNSGFFGSSGIPRFASFSFHSGANNFSGSGGPQARRQPQSDTPIFQNIPLYTAPKPQPPSTVLQPKEAKLLFQKYNERWNALAPTDSNIPYPCRGMQAHALTVRDTLWAPNTKSPIAIWSEEIVMQANAQAFYLGVVDLSPTYTEGTGAIACGFEKTRATTAQVQQLIEILKKEKTRWHSDRLGRRTGGGANAGVNESLQRDERARAVFHAVCELMDFTQ